jgi:hypothetical protein
MWVDANAFGILIRRAIEAICTAEGIKGRNLEIRLVELQKQKSLPHNIAVVAKRLRILGNRAAHDSGGLHPLHVHLIDDFFCVLVDYLYVLPSRLSYAEQYDLRTATR